MTNNNSILEVLYVVYVIINKSADVSIIFESLQNCVLQKNLVKDAVQSDLRMCTKGALFLFTKVEPLFIYSCDFHQKNHSALEELMHVNEWICYECSDEGTCTPNIRNSSTRSHALEGGNRCRNRKQKLQV